MAKAINKAAMLAGSAVEKDKLPSKTSQLPLVSRITDQAEMQEASEILQEGIELQKAVKGFEDRVAEIKVRLKELAGKHSLLDGMRYGSCAFSLVYSTRSSLDKSLLIENGVTAQQIENSMRESSVVMSKLVEVPL